MRALLTSSAVTLLTSTSCSLHYKQKSCLLTYPPRPLEAIASEFEVYQYLRRAKTKSPGTDDILLRLRREVTPEIATPQGDIFNGSISEGEVHDLWKRAFTVTITKTNPPNFHDDLRPISLSRSPRKILERMIAKYLWKTFTHKLDHRQFGNIEGSSTVHYPIDLINYINTSDCR